MQATFITQTELTSRCGLRPRLCGEPQTTEELFSPRRKTVRPSSPAACERVQLHPAFIFDASCSPYSLAQSKEPRAFHAAATLTRQRQREVGDIQTPVGAARCQGA